MDFIELAKKRYSVRAYTAQKVETEKLECILEAARVAPTGANAQSQRLIVAQTPESLTKISKAGQIFNAQLAIIVCCDMDEVWTRPFDGKHLADIDTSVVTTHMMLEATELGLGSVWVCYFKPEIIKKEFGLPTNIEPISILVLGYADTARTPALPSDRHARTRKPLSEMVTYL